MEAAQRTKQFLAVHQEQMQRLPACWDTKFKISSAFFEVDRFFEGAWLDDLQGWDVGLRKKTSYAYLKERICFLQKMIRL